MRSLAKEQALCLSLYAFSETMFKTSMGKRETFILRRKRFQTPVCWRNQS